MGIINIDKNKIPYFFDIRLNKTTYTFEFHYNAVHDFFTVGINDSTGDVLIAGEKLVLNKPLLNAHGYLNFIQITPVNTTGRETRITWENFNESVFLEVVEND